MEHGQGDRLGPSAKEPPSASGPKTGQWVYIIWVVVIGAMVWVGTTMYSAKHTASAAGSQTQGSSVSASAN